MDLLFPQIASACLGSSDMMNPKSAISMTNDVNWLSLAEPVTIFLLISFLISATLCGLVLGAVKLFSADPWNILRKKLKVAFICITLITSGFVFWVGYQLLTTATCL